MKTLKSLFGLFLVVAFFYTAYKVFPPYFNNMQFEDAMGQTAQFSAYDQRKTEQDIRDEVAKKAREYDIPLTSEQIHVTRSGGEITITADYTIHVDLPGYPLDLQFHPNSKKKRI